MNPTLDRLVRWLPTLSLPSTGRKTASVAADPHAGFRVSADDPRAKPKGDQKLAAYQLIRRFTSKVKFEMADFNAALTVAQADDDYLARVPGKRVHLYRFYQEALRDGHLRSVMQARKIKALGQAFILHKAQSETELVELTDLLRRPWFHEFCSLCLDTVFYGHSLIQFYPQHKAENGKLEFSRVGLIHREHVRPDLRRVLFDPFQEQGIDYEDPTLTGDLLLAFGQDHDLGLLMVCLPYVIWKRYALSDWSLRCEKYGMPFIVHQGIAINQVEEQRIEHMLENFGSAAWARFHADDKVSLLDVNEKGGYKTYEDFANFCNQEISKLIVGGTLTSETGEKGARSLGEVHERGLNDIVEADMRLLESHVNFSLLPFLRRHGYAIPQDVRFSFTAFLTPQQDKTTGPAAKGAKPGDNDGPTGDDGGGGPKAAVSNGAYSNASFNTPSLELGPAREDVSQGLKQLYEVRAHCCGGHELRAEGDEDELWPLIEPQLEGLYNGSIKPEQLLTDVYLVMASGLFDTMRKAWTTSEGFAFEQLPVAAEAVRRNLYAFSGAKTYAQMLELRDAVYNSGVLRPFSEFVGIARKISATYNVTYLEAERGAVVRGTTMIGLWKQIEESKEDYPYLQYQTMQDDRVRDEHRALQGLTLPVDDAFWNQYYPPNGWRCRCTVRQISQTDLDLKRAKPSDSEASTKLAGKSVKDKYWRKNLAKADQVLDVTGHPYYKAVPGGSSVELQAVQNYGMRPAEMIYAKPSKLAKLPDTLNSVEEFEAWWKQTAAARGDGTSWSVADVASGSRIVFDQKLRRHMIEASKLAERRYSIFPAAIDLIEQPDEVWASRDDRGELTAYIRYYQQRPLLVVVRNAGQERRVTTFFEAYEASDNSLNRYRKGVLLYRK